MLSPGCGPLAFASRSRLAFSSHSGQINWRAEDDLKLFPHWLQRILILLIPVSSFWRTLSFSIALQSTPVNGGFSLEQSVILLVLAAVLYFIAQEKPILRQRHFK